MAQTNNFGLEEVCDYSRHRSVAALMIYRSFAHMIARAVVAGVEGDGGRKC
jgi:hypothetical protein